MQRIQTQGILFIKGTEPLAMLLHVIYPRTIHTKTIACLLFILSCNSILFGQNTTDDGEEFPVPSGNSKQLFYLQRNKNTNTIVYELNEQNGNLNTDNPVHVFWILYPKQGRHEELSAMENKYAYGIKITSSNKESYEFTLVAYPKITLQLLKGTDQKYHVYVSPSKQQMILQKTFIKVKTSWFQLGPDVEYIEFSGIDVASGKEVIERITP